MAHVYKAAFSQLCGGETGVWTMIMPDLSVNLSELIFWTGLSYFIGSIPFGLLLAKAMGLGNLRNIGSGNIGATNVLRTGNKKAAALTLALDAAKGAFAVALALSYSGEASAQVTAISATGLLVQPSLSKTSMI